MPVGKKIVPVQGTETNEKPMSRNLMGFSVPIFGVGRFKPTG